jgi:hypothetical protein
MPQNFGLRISNRDVVRSEELMVSPMSITLLDLTNLAGSTSQTWRAHKSFVAKQNTTMKFSLVAFLLLGTLQQAALANGVSSTLKM